MKILVLAPQSRYEAFPPHTPAGQAAELIFCDRYDPEDVWLAAAEDAQAIFVTPVTRISGELMERMPNLKLIHCEGVGVDRIDLDAARQRGIYVCNNAGCNAEAVAELSIMLMSMLLHRTLWGDRMVKAGLQGEAVRQLELHIPTDLSVTAVGLVGFGAIGQAVAERLRVFGSRVFYTARHRKGPEVEARYGVTYLPLAELAERCDLMSLHLPATAESQGLIGEEVFRRMRPGSFLVNTARGAVIDDEALCRAIRSGHLAGAALDCYNPEPPAADHPLVRLAAEFPDRLVLCPHQGGVNQSAFRKAHQMLFDNLEKLAAGERPDRIVNGL